MAELLTTYASLRLQVVDACVIALAERLDVREVAALDRRDFLVVAPGTCPKENGSPCYQPTDSVLDDERLAGRPSAPCCWSFRLGWACPVGAGGVGELAGVGEAEAGVAGGALGEG